MSEATPRRVGEIVSYHAHVYYHPQSSRGAAEQVRARIAERFSVQLGRWHDATVGPHVRAMYQIAFLPEVFATLVPWLMLNRAGLSVLVHPNTDNPHDDHLVHALWLGEKLDVKGEVLPEELGEDGHTPVVPNTTPSRAV
jgi:DOPA 4,5-dioxygenase